MRSTFLPHIILAVWVNNLTAALPAAEDNAELARKAFEFLDKYCHRCHGLNGTNEKGINYIVDSRRLKDEKKILPNQPDVSLVFQVISEKEMPPKRYDSKPYDGPRPSDSEVEIIKAWIAAGAPDFVKPVNDSKPRDFIPAKRVLELILSDLENSQKTQLQLPSEAQWEYGCRAGADGPFAGTGRLHDMSWFEENSGGSTKPVGQKKPNAFGLMDMHGNVFEWCEDEYQEKFYDMTDSRKPNPICRNSGSSFRVRRGGCWRDGARYCRSAYRGRNVPGVAGDYLGFRPARPLR